MKRFLAAMVYTGLALLANPLVAGADDIAALREGDMKKLVLHATPKPFADVEIVDAGDAPLKLSEAHADKWLVVNFWATWCAPCRKEMPTLANLQARMEGKPVEVITIATGRNSVPAISKFFADIGVENLPEHRDPKQKLARELGVLGLPVTIIVNPEGQEVARLIGDAHWDSDSAVAIIEAFAFGG